MQPNRTFLPVVAVLIMGGLAACGGDDVADIETERVITTPDVEMVEVPVMTQDTSIVETEIDIDVDTVPAP